MYALSSTQWTIHAIRKRPSVWRGTTKTRLQVRAEGYETAHRNPSLRTHASTMTCWQVRVRIPRLELDTRRKARPHLR